MQLPQTLLIDIPQDLKDLSDEQHKVLAECLRATLELGVRFNSKVILFSHVYALGAALDTWLQGSLLHNAREDLVEQQQVPLNKLVSGLDAKGLTLETKVVWGKHLDDALVSAYGDNLPDLVIQPSQHHLFAASIIRQPNEWRMIRMPKVPVILQQKANALRGRVLLTVDVGELEETQESNLAAIRKAKKWCEMTDSELHIINAFPSVADLMAFAPAEWTVPQIQSTLKEQHSERLKKLAMDAGLLPDRAHVAEGQVAQVVDHFAEELDANLVMISSHCRKGMQGFFIGNTAEIVLEQTKCNLLVLKPLEE